MDLKTADGSGNTTYIASEAANGLTSGLNAKSKLGNRMNASAKLQESRPAGQTTLKLPNDEADPAADPVVPIETIEDPDSLPSPSPSFPNSSKKSILMLFKNAAVVDFKSTCTQLLSR